MRGKMLGTLNYPGAVRIEEYQLSFFQDLPESFVELPWLNLLCYLPQYEAQQDQPATIGYYAVLHSIYDREKSLFLKVKEQLKEIFPRSFLFQELEGRLQYCEDCSHILTLERLKILSQQMTALDSLDYFEEEMPLAESMRVVWRRTQMPKPHMTCEAFDDESTLSLEEFRKLTWFIPFSDKYPVMEESVKRYLVLKRYNVKLRCWATITVKLLKK